MPADLTVKQDHGTDGQGRLLWDVCYRTSQQERAAIAPACITSQSLSPDPRAPRLPWIIHGQCDAQLKILSPDSRKQGGETKL